MTPHGVPPYARVHGFALRQLPYDAYLSHLAAREYVYKANPKIKIRSTRDSKSWTIYIMGGGPPESPGWFPHGEPFGRLTDAMLAVPHVAEVIAY